jgi:anion-transporting  ArsA/GET3 family ATPase
MPQAAHEVFHAGLVGRESKRLVDLLTDPQRTAVNLVTTAEEMPVNETLEMYQRIREDLHMPLGLLFVNRIHRTELRSEHLDALERSVARLRDPRERGIAQEALNRGREDLGWANINATYRERLSNEVHMPLIEVPFLFAEEFGSEQVRAIASGIQAELRPAAQRRAAHRGHRHAST